MSELAKLMRDFSCSQSKDMFAKPLAEKTRKLKETSEGVDTMCKAIEENNKRILKNKQIEIALNLIQMKLGTYSDIAKVTGLSVEKVEKLNPNKE